MVRAETMGVRGGDVRVEASIIGGSEVESKRRVHRGVERVGQDEAEVMYVWVHGLG